VGQVDAGCTAHAIEQCVMCPVGVWMDIDRIESAQPPGGSDTEQGDVCFGFVTLLCWYATVTTVLSEWPNENSPTKRQLRVGREGAGVHGRTAAVLLFVVLVVLSVGICSSAHLHLAEELLQVLSAVVCCCVGLS
jgi:hypothetical protein